MAGGPGPARLASVFQERCDSAGIAVIVRRLSLSLGVPVAEPPIWPRWRAVRSLAMARMVRAIVALLAAVTASLALTATSASAWPPNIPAYSTAVSRLNSLAVQPESHHASYDRDPTTSMSTHLPIVSHAYIGNIPAQVMPPPRLPVSITRRSREAMEFRMSWRHLELPGVQRRACEHRG
jgi:hypothetical protein